ncbi:MAG: sulfotransferase domain-containing protein [Chitinophagales bacterium]
MFRKYFHKRDLNKRFKTEIELLGNKVNSNSNVTSIIHFSLNKAATQYVKKVLLKLIEDKSIVPVHLNEYAFNSSLPYLDHLSKLEMKRFEHVFKTNGFLYTVFGGFVEGIQNLDQYKILLTLRDPRDILTSMYYSTTISHPVPNEFSLKRSSFEKKREDSKSMDIDTFVLKNADKLYEQYEKYRKNLTEMDNVLLLKYENMIEDFPNWLDQIIDFFDLNTSTEARDNIIKNHLLKKPVKEDISKHLRKGVAGDYKEKLKPETIEKLNAKFQFVLESFNYLT